MKTLPRLFVLLVASVILSCTTDIDNALPLAQIQNNSIPTAVNVSLNTQNCNAFTINWTASTDADVTDIINYKVFINSTLVAENLTALEYNYQVNGLSYPILVDVIAYDNNLGESDSSNLLQVNTPVSNNIVFTDVRLKKGLLDNDTIVDLNGDDEISECEAFMFNGTLNLAKMNISSLSELSYFTQAKVLVARDNTISDISVLSNLSFEDIDLNLNQISSFNMTANPELKTLQLGFNQISTIDLSLFENLRQINLTDNPISNLDLTSNPLLEVVLLDKTAISQIDVTLNTALINLGVSKSAITTIDLSNNVNLEQLNVSKTQLSSLDVSVNTNLKQVFINNTNVQSLDFSNQAFLESLFCKQNVALTQLNLKNGNNVNTTQMFANINPNLTCIQVDDLNAIPVNWKKDDTSSYSLICN